MTAPRLPRVLSRCVWSAQLVLDAARWPYSGLFAQGNLLVMDTTGLITFFAAILTAAVAIAGLLAAVALAASGLMYFGVVGHSQRAMEQAQNGVRAAFIGLALVWGAKELVNLVASAAGQTGLH